MFPALPVWVKNAAGARASVQKLQHNAILEDGNFAEALLLGAGLLAGGNVQHELVQVGTGLVQRALAVRDDTGVEVDPGLFSGGQLAVGGNFQRRRGGTKRRAAARAEQHHVRTRSSQRRGGDQVVAGSVQCNILHLLFSNMPLQYDEVLLLLLRYSFFTLLFLFCFVSQNLLKDHNNLFPSCSNCILIAHTGTFSSSYSSRKRNAVG